jgi:hypothetical protein
VDTLNPGSRWQPHVLSEQERREHERRELVGSAALTFVGTALFPRLSYRLRWASRLSGRWLVMYVMLRTVEMFAFMTWGRPLMMRWIQRAVEYRKRAAVELGHEPTRDELRAYLRRRSEAEHPHRQGHDATS